MASVGARHPKVAEDVGVLSGRTIPPDTRPVVTFTRPVLDRGMVGTPNTGARQPDIVGPRSFTYILGHVVLAAGSGGNRRLIGAGGVLNVVGGSVSCRQTVPASVAGATLELCGLTYPVTSRTATGLGYHRVPPDGNVAYRLRPATLSQSVQVNQVTAAPHATASLSLVASTGTPKDAFAGGSLALGGTSWPILESDGATVLVRTKGSLPQPGTGTLTGLIPPELDGRLAASRRSVRRVGSRAHDQADAVGIEACSPCSAIRTRKRSTGSTSTTRTTRADRNRPRMRSASTSTTCYGEL